MKTNMAPLRGWGPKGKRLPAKAPYGHWKRLTFIAALRHDRIDAPFVIDGPINGELFTAYVEQVLAPTLNRGDIVILDNLGSHKGKATRQTSEKRAPTSSSCRPTAQTSILSNSSSPSSSISCEKPNKELMTRPGERSVSCSASSPQQNATTTSKTQDMLPPNRSTL